VAGYAAPPEPARAEPREERHLEAARSGALVEMDCFCIGRLAGSKGVVWQYTAIDLASSCVWAELYPTPRNPAVGFTSSLARRVARELAQAGWRLEAVMTDNGSVFSNADFTGPLERVGAAHPLIHAGRPQTNGSVERVQHTILEEC
jgi:transposase InsO family protein